MLTATESQIAQGEVLIQNQRWRVEQLQRGGHDTADAEDALRSFLHNQALQNQHRTKLERLLEKESS